MLFIIFAVVQVWKQENATLPPRIVKQRAVACGTLYQMLVGGSMMTMIYYIPLWFQAIKGVSAVQSGIDTIPFVLSLVVASIIAGGIITKNGWYNPWMIACPVLMAIGSGLITTFSVDTGSDRWIGYLFLFGFGLGIGMQQSSLAISALLSDHPGDRSNESSACSFAHAFAGCAGLLQQSANQGLYSGSRCCMRCNYTGIGNRVEERQGVEERRTKPRSRRCKGYNSVRDSKSG
jgi:MFS family permease